MVACVLIFIWYCLAINTFKKPNLKSGDRGDDIAYPPGTQRTPSRRAVGTGVGQQEMTANCTFDSI